MIGVVVLIVAIVALRDPKNPSTQTEGTRTTSRTSAPAPGPASSTPTTSPPTSPSATPTHLTRAQLQSDVPLVVLNNTTVTGLAGEAASRFESGGWKVTSTGNLVNNIISTCAYFDPDVAHARAAARALQRQYPDGQAGRAEVRRPARRAGRGRAHERLLERLTARRAVS